MRAILAIAAIILVGCKAESGQGWRECHNLDDGEVVFFDTETVYLNPFKGTIEFIDEDGFNRVIRSHEWKCRETK